MSKIVSGGLVAAILAVPLLAQQAQDPAPQPGKLVARQGESVAVDPAAGDIHGLPGKRAGTERWIVHFKTRSFDLTGYRNAIHGRRPAAEVAKIVAELERKVVEDQRAFVEQAQKDLDADLVAQWWLINACAVDVPFDNLARLRAMPNVDFLEPDREWHPVILKATGSKNHNSDYVQNVLKIDGSGVAVGIVDTGQDERVGSLSRPHRTYFIGGDASNTSGPGLGGSRLLINRQHGTQPADDVHGHGTGVASIVAGGRWGSAGADHGHAFGANITGYSIANTTSGSSSSTTMASAWNQMAADRAKYNIVAANLSYSGSPSLTDSAQQAIDSASFNADIMCCTAAGNSGTSSTASANSQSNANGLAVAAITPDTHTMASFSSRGPLYNSGGRFFPDISGCGVSTVMARRDAETSDYVGSGTSMASPQVCGVAALVRAANTKLTALETKAILLATTQSIASENPSFDRNSYGTGMLRGDLAVTLALASSGHGTVNVDSSNRTIRVPVSVTDGKQYAAAITWHRTNMSSTSYSNLDMKILDGTTLIAESKTPLNLYENVRFLSRKTGTFTLEITSPTLVPSSQMVAYAFTEAPAAPIPGTVTAFGQGCNGTVKSTGEACVAFNVDESFQTLALRASTGYALEVTAPKALTVTGFDIRTQATSNKTLSTALYLPNSSGVPSTIAATGTIQVTTTMGWRRTTFSKPVQVAQNSRFFVFIQNDASPNSCAFANSGTPVPYFRLTTVWTSRITTPFNWEFRVNCPGGNFVPPTLGSVGTPDIGSNITFAVREALPNSAAIFLAGDSKTSWSGLQLPWALPGAPGCSAYVAGQLMAYRKTDAAGTLDVTLGIPVNKGLIGKIFYAQVAVQDPQANNFGFAMSGALALMVGGTP